MSADSDGRTSEVRHTDAVCSPRGWALATLAQDERGHHTRWLLATSPRAIAERERKRG